MPESTAGTPFDEGLDAYGRDVPREDCPYSEGSDEREEWLEGWDSQKPMPGDDQEEE